MSAQGVPGLQPESPAAQFHWEGWNTNPPEERTAVAEATGGNHGA